MLLAIAERHQEGNGIQALLEQRRGDNGGEDKADDVVVKECRKPRRNQHEQDQKNRGIAEPVGDAVCHEVEKPGKAQLGGNHKD